VGDFPDGSLIISGRAGWGDGERCGRGIEAVVMEVANRISSRSRHQPPTGSTTERSDLLGVPWSASEAGRRTTSGTCCRA
jgi:hypothetical protein